LGELSDNRSKEKSDKTGKSSSSASLTTSPSHDRIARILSFAVAAEHHKAPLAWRSELRRIPEGDSSIVVRHSDDD
ncbi:hypothetical protein, partial [Roseiconus lacunae]